MAFSSIPVYLHAPSWQQQPVQHVGESYRIDNPPHHHHHQLLHQPLPPEAGHHVAGAAAGLCKPGSMSDRARQANIPQPEAGLKCPRCESTNTKFCYFNNYSLSQPRHFCKACRRYWTRGGALRNVPVGGGSRRNKKNKRSSKSPAATDDRQAISNPDGENIIVSRSYTSDSIMSQLPQQPSQLPLMTSLQNINGRYGVGNLGLNVGAQIQVHADPSGFHMGDASTAVDQQWRFPFMLSTTFDHSPASIATPYQFQSHQSTVETPPASTLVGDNPLGMLTSSSTVTTTRATTTTDQLPPVKYEDHRAINLATSSLPSFPANGNHQYWAIGNSWTDMSALNSSSTGHHLL